MIGKQRQSGFTIIELLVAMSIATLMGFLINLIFIEASDAVSRGVATSKVINNSRTLGDQLTSDFQHQLNPTGNGALVIVSRVYPANSVWIMDAQSGGPIRSPRPIRSDQIGFIYDNANFENDIYEPITPGSMTSFSNGGNADYARIWYGHVLKTNPDGTDPASPALGNDPTTNNDANSYANQWMLGRQALFLDDNTTIAVRANGIWPTAPVVGYTGDINGSIATKLSSGLTDLAYFSLANAASNGGIANGYLVAPAATADTVRPILADDVIETDYESRAITVFTYASEILRGNPFPGGTTFYSSQVGQMHPCFMENVSDFIVEFAADADNSGDIDRVTAGANAGEILWYSFDSAPDDVGFVNWNAGFTNPEVAAAASPTTRAWVFRHNETQLWPHLLRFRVRMHDSRGSLMDTNDALLSDTYDNDGDGLIDAAGGDFDEYTEPGLWFEFIVKVNRS